MKNSFYKIYVLRYITSSKEKPSILAKGSAWPIYILYTKYYYYKGELLYSKKALKYKYRYFVFYHKTRQKFVNKLQPKWNVLLIYSINLFKTACFIISYITALFINVFGY